MEMIEIIIGSLLLSVVHFLIPNHWLPLVTISRSEKWTLLETVNITMITAFAHTASTIALGIVIGMIGYRLAGKYQAFAELAAPLILLAMGLLYIGIDLGQSPHAHFPKKANLIKKSKRSFIISLCVVMFFSPCFEIETYFLAAGSFGWKGIGLISLLYLLVTITGITVMVWTGYQSLQKLQWHWIEHHEKKITGAVLILLGIYSFFV